NPAPDLTGSDAARDPYFDASDVGSDKPSPTVGDPERRRRQFRIRTLMLVVALAAVWMGVLLDPNIAPLVLLIVGAFGIGLAVMAAAMALGLLGFGLFAGGDRVIAWLRRGSRWPDS